jgi:hypothetical protein
MQNMRGTPSSALNAQLLAYSRSFNVSIRCSAQCVCQRDRRMIMALTLAVDNVEALGQGIWLVDIPPHQVRLFGAVAPSVGTRSAIAVNKAEYNEVLKTLTFQIDHATVLNVGVQNRAIVIDAGIENSTPDSALNKLRSIEPTLVYGAGDGLFLSLVDRLLSTDMQAAGHALLDGVRRRFPGNLKKGKKNNFSETPDNFWYVVVQPRVDELQVTVRGDVNHFKGISSLLILDDRGNTRFKIRGQSDIAEALKLIFHAKRKL